MFDTKIHSIHPIFVISRCCEDADIAEKYLQFATLHRTVLHSTYTISRSNIVSQSAVEAMNVVHQHKHYWECAHPHPIMCRCLWRLPALAMLAVNSFSRSCIQCTALHQRVTTVIRFLVLQPWQSSLADSTFLVRSFDQEVAYRHVHTHSRDVLMLCDLRKKTGFEQYHNASTPLPLDTHC